MNKQFYPGQDPLLKQLLQSTTNLFNFVTKLYDNQKTWDPLKIRAALNNCTLDCFNKKYTIYHRDYRSGKYDCF